MGLFAWRPRRFYLSSWIWCGLFFFFFFSGCPVITHQISEIAGRVFSPTADVLRRVPLGLQRVHGARSPTATCPPPRARIFLYFFAFVYIYLYLYLFIKSGSFLRYFDFWFVIRHRHVDLVILSPPVSFVLPCRMLDQVRFNIHHVPHRLCRS